MPSTASTSASPSTACASSTSSTWPAERTPPPRASSRSLGYHRRMALAPAAARPLRVGDLTLSSPVLVAPMAGITDAAFRGIPAGVGAGLVTTERVAAEAVVRSQEASIKLLDFPAEVTPVAAQLVGSDPAVMAGAAQLCVERGAMAVDVNLGCPVRKVVGLGHGAALARHVPRPAAVL